MAANRGSGSKTTPDQVSDDSSSETSSEDDETDPRKILETALPWKTIYSLVDPQTAELSWSIKGYEPSSPEHKDEKISDSYGIIRGGEIAAIVGPTGSAVDGMALILSGMIRSFNGTVRSDPSTITLIEDIDDFRYILPGDITVYEAVDFYLKVSISPCYGNTAEFDAAVWECVEEFHLADVEGLRCSYLNSTHSKLLYMLSMLLNPLPILILHNPERYLDDQQCLTVANRLNALASGGHSVLICSTQVSEVFLDVCAYMHVFHHSGVVIYGGSPKGFSAFLLSQGIAVNIFSSISENIFRAGGFNEKIMERIEYYIDKSPIPPDIEAEQRFSEAAAEAPSTFRRHLMRTLFILVRNPSLLLTRAVMGLVVVVYCASATILRVDSDDIVSNRKMSAIMALDIVLMMIAGVGLVFGFIESRLVDILLVRESQGVGRFSKPAHILTVRLITRCAIDLCTSTTISLVGLLLCNAFGTLSARASIILLPLCALLYGYLGAFCALFNNWSYICLPFMLITFMWSILAALTPLFEIQAGRSFVWRFSSPLYLVKAIVLTDGDQIVRSGGRSIKYYDKRRDINMLLTVMDFRLPSAFYVNACVAVLISFLIATMAAYFTYLHKLLKKRTNRLLK